MRLISEFMTSQPSQQTTTIQTLPNISQCKDNEIIKFGQVIDYNKRNTFVQKSCIRQGKKTSSKKLYMGKRKWYAA